MDLDVLHLLAQVGRAGQHVVRVLFEELRRERPARDHPVLAGVNLQRPDRRHDHGGVRRKARRSAFDVEEALGAHVGAEAGLGDEEIAGVDADQVRQHRRGAVGDVPKRPRVHQHRRVLERLQQVRLDRVAHDHGHRAARVQEVGGDGLAVAGEADDHPPQSLPHVLKRGRQRKHRHHLRRGRDVEARLARHTVLRRAEAHHHVAQHAVAHVEDAAPRDAVQVDREVTQAVVDVVVDHGRQQVVRRGDRVEVAGEVKIEPLHRHHLAVAASGRAALDPERRSHGRLADRDRRALAHAPERIAEADGGRGLALAERRRCDRGNDDVFRARPVLELFDRVELDLRHVVPIGLEQMRIDPHAGSDLGHRLELCLARDLQVGRELHLHHTLLRGEKASLAATSRSVRSR